MDWVGLEVDSMKIGISRAFSPVQMLENALFYLMTTFLNNLAIRCWCEDSQDENKVYLDKKEK